MRQQSPRRKSFSLMTRLMTPRRPFSTRIRSRSPMRFMAAESITSPALEASTSIPMAVQSLSEFMLLLGCCERRIFLSSLSERRPSRHETHAAGDEQDAGPSPGTDGFMQENTRQESCDDVAEGRGRQDEGEICPGERGEVRIEKSGEKKNAENDPGINEGIEDVGPVVEVDFAEVFHAAFEQHVARAVAAGDGQIDEDFLELHSDVRHQPA